VNKHQVRKRDLHIRLTDDELARLNKCANDLGVTKSDYVRLITQLPQSLFAKGGEAGTISRTHQLVSSPASIRRLEFEAGKWGNNYNQGVHALNTIMSCYVHADRIGNDYREEVLSLSRCALSELEIARAGIRQMMETVRGLLDQDLIIMIENRIDARIGQKCVGIIPDERYQLKPSRDG